MLKLGGRQETELTREPPNSACPRVGLQHVELNLTGCLGHVLSNDYLSLSSSERTTILLNLQKTQRPLGFLSCSRTKKLGKTFSKAQEMFFLFQILKHLSLSPYPQTFSQHSAQALSHLSFKWKNYKKNLTFVALT